jgi:hypothetical protein
MTGPYEPMRAAPTPRRRRRLLWLALAVASVLVCISACWLGLYAGLRSSSAYVRWMTTYPVGGLRLNSLAPNLVPMLRNTQHIESEYAAWALGRMGDPQYIPPLIQLLKCSGFEEGEAASYALLDIGDCAALPDLADVASNPEYGIIARRYARFTIARLTGAPELKDFQEELGDSWDRDNEGGYKYTEEQQLALFRAWWERNKGAYTSG